MKSMTTRRSMFVRLALGFFLSAISLNGVIAQVPRSISYQGFLLKSNQPVNTNVLLHLKIYDAAGAMLYEETDSSVSVKNGIFNVLIGGASGDIPTSLKFDGQYYLGVDIDNSGELTRTPFAAAPYALNSQLVGGIGVS